MRRHRREGGVQCRAEADAGQSLGYSVAARVKVPGSRKIKGGARAINPARGGEVPPVKN